MGYFPIEDAVGMVNLSSVIFNYNVMRNGELRHITAQLTPDAAVGYEDEVVFRLFVGGTHVVDLGVHANLLASVKDLQKKPKSVKLIGKIGVSSHCTFIPSTPVVR